jgi:hypothetical protein
MFLQVKLKNMVNSEQKTLKRDEAVVFLKTVDVTQVTYATGTANTATSNDNNAGGSQ